MVPGATSDPSGPPALTRPRPAPLASGVYNKTVTGDAQTEFCWRGDFTSTEVNALHSQAFSTRLYSDDEWDWRALVERHSLGWVVARRADELIGFVNVVWDGFVHAWLQDEIVAVHARGSGVGTGLVRTAIDEARSAGCEWLHVDFEDDLEPFYFDACGFVPTKAGLLQL